MATRTTGIRPGTRWTGLRPWLATVVRLVLAGLWLYAGLAKLTDLGASVRAVNGYQLVPNAAAQVIGPALPFAEFGLGLLLLVGLAVRFGAVSSAILLATFIGAIGSAWARGLAIDCGCFGGGGQVGAGRTPEYAVEIARDSVFLLLALLLAVWPRTRFSVDSLLFGPEPEPAEFEPAEFEPAEFEPAEFGTEDVGAAGRGAEPGTEEADDQAQGPTQAG